MRITKETNIDTDYSDPRRCGNDDLSPIDGSHTQQKLVGGDPYNLRDKQSRYAPPKKRVRWSTITVHEFGVGLGGSSVSTRGGPSIGLADTPEFTWTTKVGEMAQRNDGVGRFSPEQRTELLKQVGIADGIISRYARETNIILRSRRRTYEESSDEGDDDDEEDIMEKEYISASHKRKADSMSSRLHISHSQLLPFRRPRMIPANYV